MTYIPVLTHATERDIDLLLVEELACSPSFVFWLLRRVYGQVQKVRSSEVLHSTRRTFSRREIDIRLRATTDHGDVLLLIENKLDADEQPDQAISYREEAEEIAHDGLTVRTAIVSPKTYASAHADFTNTFDAAVSYEEIENYFVEAGSGHPELASRLHYRANLIRQAIDKGRRGYSQVIHPAKRAFSARYIAMLSELAPELKPGPSMLRESAAESVTMIFAPSSLPRWSFLPQMRIVHQLRDANANLNFYGWGDAWGQLAAPVAAALDGTGFYAEPTVNKRKNGSSSLKIVMRTPQIDQFGNFQVQADAIRQGIHMTEKLRNWMIAHEGDIREWAGIVAKTQR